MNPAHCILKSLLVFGNVVKHSLSRLIYYTKYYTCTYRIYFCRIIFIQRQSCPTSSSGRKVWWCTTGGTRCWGCSPSSPSTVTVATVSRVYWWTLLGLAAASAQSVDIGGFTLLDLHLNIKCVTIDQDDSYTMIRLIL